MPGGCIHYLRSAYASGRLHFEQVWNHFRDRIDADKHAFTGKHRLSKLGLTPTNAFLSVVPDSSVSMTVGRVRNCEVDKSLLHGIPLGVKDNFCTNFDLWGLPTTCASRALENFCAMYDASVVASLTNQGALLLGKTNMDEFAMGCGATDGVISGPVINPWCHMQQTNYTNDSYLTLIAGGSSGGSAAAVAAGLCVAALASDTGGSARIPAAHCGVVGLKPTYGLLSRHGLIPLMNAIDVPSVMSTCVSDIAAILAAWINPKDDLARTMDATCVSVSEDLVKHWHSDLNLLATGTDSDDMAQHLNKLKTPIRIGIPVEYHVPGLDPELCEHWDRVACWFADQLACDVRQVRLPHTPMTTTVYSVLCATEVASNMAKYDGLKFGFRSAKNFDQENYVNPSSESKLSDTELLFSSTRSIGFGDVVRSRVFAGNFFLLRSQAGRHLEAARRLWRLIKHDFDEVFETVDFLLTPVCPNFPIPIDEFKRLDNRTRTTLDDVCTVGANLAGVPAISLPVARSTTTGLPISLQLIGPAFSEPQLLRLAAQLEMGMSFSPLVDLKKIIDNI